jgi:hypothetical protein
MPLGTPLAFISLKAWVGRRFLPGGRSSELRFQPYRADAFLRGCRKTIGGEVAGNLSERIDQGLQVSITTEQRQALRLAEAQRLEAARQAMLDTAAEQVAQAISLAGSAAAEPRDAAPDPRRTALDTARDEFVAAALAHRDAVAQRDSVWRSFGVAQRTRRRMERLRVLRERRSGAA